MGRHHPLLLPDPAGKTGQTPPEYNSVSLNLVLLLFLLLLLLLLSLFLLLLLLKILHIYFSPHLAACSILVDTADPLLLSKYPEWYLGCLCPAPPWPSPPPPPPCLLTPPSPSWPLGSPTCNTGKSIRIPSTAWQHWQLTERQTIQTRKAVTYNESQVQEMSSFANCARKQIVGCMNT